MVSYSTEQEAFTAAWILGGPEGVREAAMAKHRQILAAVEEYKARTRPASAVIEPKGADLQEAQPKEP